jgi:hypothetical protein
MKQETADELQSATWIREVTAEIRQQWTAQNYLDGSVLLSIRLI